ncbi:glycosyltransferase involved in cell wall biosynthesis [Prosthecobacter fusiformis]|uniref:Glycosyltransferase involved in cell wall biosynthesis n=1 Tax=Prosthecobacter fusiformis TaxID=48464 RepID=A0A4R7RR88_9BACT|nr:glycosyltransferase [Prosthecobacter fusiformis]TDU68082.1 glycosyltransferase involved in cell wall biosynthesis [Prosthecobacter fusiformis]
MNAALKNRHALLTRLAGWTELGLQSAGHGLHTAGHLAATVGKRIWPGKPMEMKARKTVVHFIAAPGGGGAEAMLGNLVAAMKGGMWRTEVILVDGRGWPEAVAKLEAAGAVVHDLEAEAFLRPATLLRLIRLLKKIKPDVVQTWMHHADFVGGWCARLAGVKSVVWGIHCREIHRNPGDSDLKMGVLRWMMGGSSRVVPTSIISCSEVAMTDHLKLGYPKDAMKWVPNGIDTGRFIPDAGVRRAVRKELKVPEGATLVGFVGRFHEMKNLATWLRAAALLQARRPETHFWLCGGEEWDLDDCSRAALSVMPHRNQVHFTDFRAEPERVYPALDLFSLSSRTEACPMTVMEAMSCGVPCVTTDVGDCARLLEGVGKVVPVRNPEALERAWEEMLERPVSSALVRRYAVERFDIAVAARHYAKVYGEVLGL